MQILDYSALIDTVAAFSGTVPAEGFYEHGEGIRLCAEDAGTDFLHETVRLSERAMLLVTDAPPARDNLHQQVIGGEEDWIHIQFRFSGGGFERILGRNIETPERSCIISRYPRSSVIEREISKSSRRKYACLYLSPRALIELLDVPLSIFPENTEWVAAGVDMGFKASVVPLQTEMALAVNDILRCPLRGAIRRSYMRAKSLELLSLVIHVLARGAERAPHPGVHLSAADLGKISLARNIMVEDLGHTLTLATLARRVGLNRTKLALGFKDVYGESVQAFWRDARLVRAQELLRTGSTSVTDVALSLGYAELSSFTRAFNRKFGILPKSVKKSAG